MPEIALDKDGTIAQDTLRRLHQLALEIRTALDRGNWWLLTQATGLLEPTLNHWLEARSALPAEDLPLAHQTRELLKECETRLTETMQTTADELKRLKRGRQVVAAVRSRAPQATANGKLDTRR